MQRQEGDGRFMNKAEAAAMSSRDMLAKLDTSEQGLSQAEVKTRQLTYGRNALTARNSGALPILARQFKSVLVYFLLVAAIVAFVTNDLSDGVIITAILLINAFLGFIQEYRSERTIEALSSLIMRRALVVRDGQRVLVDVTDLVPGDIAVLKEGDVVPADLKLLTSDQLEMNESPLTGESASIVKGASSTTAGGAEATLLFAGSIVEEGEATGVVYAIGNQTQLGGIATLSTGIRRVTQYERSLQAFSTLLIRIILLTLGLAFIVKLAITRSLSSVPELLLFIIALAIAVVPEALPVIATVTLSRGAQQLAKDHVVVKRLPALEDLGNVTVLCTDKTGTLTENRMVVQKTVTDDATLFQTLVYAAAGSHDQTGAQSMSSYDDALLATCSPEVQAKASRFRELHEIPFDPAVRRRRVVLEDQEAGKQYLVVIGSAETLLDLSNSPKAQAYRDEIASEGREGLRHLAVAYSEVKYTDTFDVSAHEHDLTFLGFVALSDPLRPSTRPTMEMAEKLGVAIKILTGDSKEVAGYVAGQIDLLPAGGRVYTGDEIEAMTPDELARTVRQSSIFARVSPQQKYAIIQALKVYEVVGYQGDGINDAPALKLADVGIAVDSATDVAKSSADIILLKPDLAVIINGIRYGRAIFANINKYIKYTMVGNFGNYFALTALFLVSFTLPLLPRQVLLISLLTDVPLVTIATDTVSDDEVLRPEKYDVHSLMFISLVLGSLTALFELAFFATLSGQTAGFAETSLYLFFSFTQLVVIFSIRSKVHFWREQPPSRPLTIAIGATFLVMLALPYIGPLAAIFAFVPLPLGVLALIIGASALYLVVLDIVKVWYYQTIPAHPTGHG
jgi:Mg2+-importing ATPase